ncbi:MAG TPA: glycosyltransferase family 4 protein [Candidatus Moranbacteria bacterium]|nr:glycosyltransferase family 4 protein [Candidatus Moranbacteria bacterium]HRY28114.1 glycosyltransferase family 4 protein [Candidatus Moranbacteria bacterium]HSA08279.1 glycosyltransferase family 4 protein [Candidatus Moranbacteria bacterium]
MKIAKRRNKKICLGIIIDTDLRIPPFTGVTYRLYYFSQHLIRFGLEIKIFLCNRNIRNSKEEKILYDKSGIEFNVLPEDFFYSPNKMLKLIQKKFIDILQFEDSVSILRYKEIFQKLNIPACLEIHDVESSLKEMLNYCSDDIKKTNIISNKACKLANKIICMTPLDYSELIHKIGADKKKISIIPNPINIKEFKFFGPSKKRNNIIFIGNMFYWPNANAVEVIIKTIVPTVHKKNPDTFFYFVGKAPDNLIQMESEKIIFTGKVDDLNSVLKNATIALCPIYEGSGMKVKVLNYCASGLPVITTSIGASGYEKVKSLLVENNINCYPVIINDLLNKRKRLVKIGERNRKYIEKNFDINVLSLKMIKIYKKLLKQSAISNNNFFNTENVPLPLWLSEKRNNKINNKNYYIIKNGKTIFKKKIA